MKFRPYLLFSVFILGLGVNGCSEPDDDDDSPLPDAVFNATVTGAIDQVISITLEEQVATNFSVNGSHSSATDLFLMSAMELSGAWQFGLSYSADMLQAGTYDVSEASGFSNTSQVQSGFLATSGSVTLSKVDLYQGVGSGIGAADDYFVDGSFTMTMQSNDTPPLEIQVSGTFTGINIKSN